LVGKVVAARVPQHVRMDTIDAHTLAGRLHQIVDCATRRSLKRLARRIPALSPQERPHCR
jgi:hypothetical protein